MLVKTARDLVDRFESAVRNLTVEETVTSGTQEDEDTARLLLEAVKLEVINALIGK